MWTPLNDSAPGGTRLGEVDGRAPGEAMSTRGHARRAPGSRQAWGSHGAPRRSARFRRALVSAIALVAIIALAGCSPEDGDADERAGDNGAPEGGNPAGAPPGPGEIDVPVEEATETTERRMTTVTGRLEPGERVGHNVPVDGLVGEIAVEPGDRVSEDDVLFVVERDEIGSQYQPANVRARRDGIVSDVSVSTQAQVSPGDAGVTIVGEAGHQVTAEVSDKDAFHVSVGADIQASTPDGEVLEGVLARRSQEPDYETGLFSLTFSFGEDPGVNVGSFLTIELPAEAFTGVFAPRDALDRQSGRYYLWVIDEEEDIIMRRHVEPAETIGDKRLIADGIEAGGRYLAVLSGNEQDGAPAPGSNGDGGDTEADSGTGRDRDGND